MHISDFFSNSMMVLRGVLKGGKFKGSKRLLRLE